MIIRKLSWRWEPFLKNSLTSIPFQVGFLTPPISANAETHPNTTPPLLKRLFSGRALIYELSADGTPSSGAAFAGVFFSEGKLQLRTNELDAIGADGDPESFRVLFAFRIIST